MGYLTAIAHSEFKAALSKILAQRIKMLSSLANQYHQLSEQVQSELQIGASVVDHTLFIKRIMAIDDSFAEKEEALFEEYRNLIRENSKIVKAVEMLDLLDHAIAECKNKINLAVTAVRQEATTLYSPAKKIGVSGTPLVRLEYLKDLTFEKEIKIFHDIIEEK